ncbi:MAG: DUF86 domain-containing protein [Negativicutes bacterium]|nr:DUF86 domain-containing protein [Negativicutes bacterium]
MVKREILERKLLQMEKSLAKVKSYRPLSYEEFVNHPVARDVVEYNLFIIINCMIDIVNHIVADDGLGEVDSLAEGFRILADYGYWTKSQLAVYTKMVAFRNMIAHQYTDISADVVYDALQHKLEDIATFKRQIMNKL